MHARWHALVRIMLPPLRPAAQDKEHFANLAVDAVMRLKGSGNLEAIHIIKKTGGTLQESFLDEGFILDKKIGVGQPKRIENAKILIANTPMDTDKIKIYGARVRVDSMAKVRRMRMRMGGSRGTGACMVLMRRAMHVHACV